MVSDGAGVRRSPFLVTYWESDEHWVYNYLKREEQHCSATMLSILDATGDWTDRGQIYEAVSGEERAEIDATVEDMLRDGLLDSADSAPHPHEEALSEWDAWNPAAGFFHAVTGSMPPLDASAPGTRGSRFFRRREAPPALKAYPDHGRFELPTCAAAGQLADVLRSRRTWREFGDRKLTLDELASLLGLTFGVEKWLEVGDDRWCALKSSPSGGARHSIEAYLLAFNVDGLENGTYHYGPDSHALTLLEAPASRDLLPAFIPTQAGFHNPAAIVVMTSVFARMQWKYPHPHAYRVVLMDAGHLSQTFALVATARGLAPFCTAAVDGPLIEQHLEIDGISESVMLVLGVGPRPAGKDWAPTHDHSALPRTTPPGWAARVAHDAAAAPPEHRGL